MNYLHKNYFLFLGLLTLVLFSCKEKNLPSNTEEIPSTPTSMTNNYTSHNVPWSEIAGFEKTPYDHRIAYGEEALQFGELRLPEGEGPFPVVVFIHGGCWLSAFNLDHVSTVCTDLSKAGYAVWTPEYRRVGDEGGGWTGTFDDAAKATDYLRNLAVDYPLDLDKVVLMGHSAGGHLALWLAARKNLPTTSPLYSSNPLAIKGVVALAAISDLAEYDKVGNSCSVAVPQLMGGAANEQSERYHQASPILLLPTGTPTRLVHGDLDNIVPLSQSQDFVQEATSKGDNVQLFEVEGAGHFDMASPYSAAWEVVKEALEKL